MLNSKVGICQWSFPVEGPEACKAAAELGLEGMELNLEAEDHRWSLSRDAVQKLFLEAGREWGIAFPSLGVNALCTHGASKAPGEQKVKEFFDLAVSIAAAMHIPLLQIPSFGDGEIDTAAELEQTAKMLSYGCRKAAEHGILVGTENALTVENNLRLLAACGCANLKVYFDTQNSWAMKGCRSQDILKGLFPRVCEVHVKDGLAGTLGNARLGQGDSSLDETLAILRERKYAGWLILENEYRQPGMIDPTADPAGLIAGDLEYLRQFFARR